MKKYFIKWLTHGPNNIQVNDNKTAKCGDKSSKSQEAYVRKENISIFILAMDRLERSQGEIITK